MDVMLLTKCLSHRQRAVPQMFSWDLFRLFYYSGCGAHNDPLLGLSLAPTTLSPLDVVFLVSHTERAPLTVISLERLHSRQSSEHYSSINLHLIIIIIPYLVPDTEQASINCWGRGRGRERSSTMRGRSRKNTIGSDLVLLRVGPSSAAWPSR